MEKLVTKLQHPLQVPGLEHALKIYDEVNMLSDFGLANIVF